MLVYVLCAHFEARDGVSIVKTIVQSENNTESSAMVQSSAIYMTSTVLTD